jgi:hypothetical protein
MSDGKSTGFGCRSAAHARNLTVVPLKDGRSSSAATFFGNKSLFSMCRIPPGSAVCKADMTVFDIDVLRSNTNVKQDLFYEGAEGCITFELRKVLLDVTSASSFGNVFLADSVNSSRNRLEQYGIDDVPTMLAIALKRLQIAVHFLQSADGQCQVAVKADWYAPCPGQKAVEWGKKTVDRSWMIDVALVTLGALNQWCKERGALLIVAADVNFEVSGRIGLPDCRATELHELLKQTGLQHVTEQ